MNNSITITQTAYYKFPDGREALLQEGTIIQVPQNHPADQPYVLQNLGQGELLRD